MLDTKQVKEIFENFAGILLSYKLPLIVQTMTSRTYQENGLEDDGVLSVEEKALYFVVLRIFGYTTSVDFIRNFEIVCDEVIGKPGARKSYEKLSSLTDMPYVKFRPSHSNVLLQVADFYAFCLKRHQLLAIKSNRTDFDKWFIQMTNDAFYENPSSGFRPAIISNEHNAEDYDSAILQRYFETGSYPFWKKYNPKKDK